MSCSTRFTFATLPRTERGQPIVVGTDPKGERFLYTQGNSVIIRSLAEPQRSDVYTQHSCQVNVAKFAPSGYYIASADKSGKVRIWDTVNEEHILKNEYQPLSGPIKDLAWSNDSQRIVIVGEGREKFGHVFLTDTGTSNGDITGQSRPVNSCDFKPSRPFRIVTGSEDNTAAFYEGPPFKFKGTKTDHTRYCQAVRYSPDGSLWASAGFDGKVFVYDGKDSELKCELTDGDAGQAHAGGVYGLAWSPCSRKLLTVSGDKSAKIWDVETKRVIAKFAMGSAVTDQQVGCLWSGSHILTFSLSGKITYLDPDAPSKPKRVIEGHNKPITGLDLSGPGAVATCAADGKVVLWSVADGSATTVAGRGHESQVNGIRLAENGVLLTIGLDDCLRFIDVQSASYTDASVKLNGQPKDVDHVTDLTAIVTEKAVILLKKETVIHEEVLNYDPTCIAVSSVRHHVAVGDANNSVRVYEFAGDGLEEKSSMALAGAPTSLRFSPDQKYLVASDSNRRVTLFSADTFEKAHSPEWGFHTARVNCTAWAPNGLYVASGGLDCSIIIWSVDNPDKHHVILAAHTQSQINGLRWLDNSTLVSVGQDGNTKVWDIDWP